ncbi:MBL fold metallo-hydrolase [Helcobacillus massiliensis]|uniref:MBL fold metallo-hydrolase n=1 Tax=Helcobacillus TaxID=1161125 RepID=UPI001EF407A8|nr:MULTISPECIES: MBL fold metallo-hydrolase [Helcobacillus]MCG7427891.1 MBL fold metallo-hydrolase [Helcobacillus sp. ACRRO]MCT1557611.1 MBL fold metallo-hydrolase [Helcobacillus massiliensis]MCT2037526.1 MBL fold metallo-hydrolase [Helcobacillus massiliensis]MCT2331847.1 MBL fold metallo-hydrolase [Helcobacillus massiliensis]
MILERFGDDDLSQVSYLVGCPAAGEAIVIDPRRDIQVYLDRADALGVRITAVTETHIHADYLSGTRELAAATGARIFLSGEGGTDWAYGYDATLLHSGDDIQIGSLTIEAVHTPGHTPEHLMFLVADGSRTTDVDGVGEVGYAFTGDFVFVGDLGRPDLLDEVAGGTDTRYEGARQLFDSLREHFLPLEDYVQVLPAHGAGSACGKAMSAVPTTTVGYEREFAWWVPYVRMGDLEGFTDQLLNGQPDAHAYFSRMKRQNRQGPAILGERPGLAEFSGGAAQAALADGSHVLIDARGLDDIAEGVADGSLTIPAPRRLASFGAWAVDPETDSAGIILLAASEEKAQRMADHLVRVGIDRVVGFIRCLDGIELHSPASVGPEELDGFGHDMLLDVRQKAEFARGTIPGAQQLSAGRVLWDRCELRQGRIVVFCQSGVRSAVAASVLRRAGLDVVELTGGFARYCEATAERRAEKPQLTSAP